eukprot:s826_g11.t1
MVWSSLTRKAICLVLALWAGLVWYLFLAASSRERNILAGAKVVGSRVRQLLRHDRALPASGTTLAPGAAHPCGKCYSGHVDGACCWEVRSNRVRAAFSDKPKLQWYAFDVFGDTESQSASLPVRASPLFHLLPSRQELCSGSKADLDCGLQAVSQDALKLELAFNLSCSNGLLASFSAWLPNEDSIPNADDCPNRFAFHSLQGEALAIVFGVGWLASSWLPTAGTLEAAGPTELDGDEAPRLRRGHRPRQEKQSSFARSTGKASTASVHSQKALGPVSESIPVLLAREGETRKKLTLPIEKLVDIRNKQPARSSYSQKVRVNLADMSWRKFHRSFGSSEQSGGERAQDLTWAERRSVKQFRLGALLAAHACHQVEHPMGVVTAHGSSDSPDLYTGQLQHLKSLAKPTSEVPWDYGFVIGGFSEMSQDRACAKIIPRLPALTAAGPPKPNGPLQQLVRFLQLPGAAGYGLAYRMRDAFPRTRASMDPWPNETLISSLRPDKMSEGSCLQRVEAFGEEVVRKRGAKLDCSDSFLWDDGWDNPQTLWEFDAARFPRRFEKVASKAKEYGAGTGVWLSPWGGYGFTQEERVKYGKRQGYETNYNRNIQSEAFSLAGKKYRKAFHETAMSFRREQGVNMFKFDGVAGNPTELGMEMEAMLQTIAALRGEKVDKSSDEKDEDDVWINLTTGTWPSPFFLFWADSIWRGGPDIATRPRDWYGPVKAPDHFQKGRFTLPSLSQIGLDGLTGRQRWIRWRSMVVYMLVARRSTFFPLSQLMIHGVVVASHGDALHWELDKYDSVDFTQEVWSFVALGLQLQELYVAPRHMTAEAWDILAEALKWSRQHAAILRDSHWAFGDVTRYKVYCVASWDVVSKRSRFNLNEVLELPLAQRKETFTVTLVKSAFRPTAKSEAIERLPGWNCTSTFHEGSTSACRLLPTAQVQVVLEATEVLVLQHAVRGRRPSNLGKSLPRRRPAKWSRPDEERPERVSAALSSEDLGLDGLAAGLEDWGSAVDLVRLEIRMEGLEQLPTLSRVPQLRILVLSGNKISSLEALQGCPKLEELVLCQNALTCLDGLRHLRHLSVLKATMNAITDAEDLAQLPQLRVVDLSKNRLTSVHLSAKGLGKLVLYRNSLQSAGFLQELPSLTQLDLGRNKLTELDAAISEWNPVLTKAFLYENSLVSLPELHLPLLTDLWGLGQEMFLLIRVAESLSAQWSSGLVLTPEPATVGPRCVLQAIRQMAAEDFHGEEDAPLTPERVKEFKNPKFQKLVEVYSNGLKPLVQENIRLREELGLDLDTPLDWDSDEDSGDEAHPLQQVGSHASGFVERAKSEPARVRSQAQDELESKKSSSFNSDRYQVLPQFLSTPLDKATEQQFKATLVQDLRRFSEAGEMQPLGQDRRMSWYDLFVNTLSQLRLPMSPNSEIALAWDILGLFLIAYDVFAIPLQAFPLDEDVFTESMGWITLCFWTTDMVVSNIVGFFDGPQLVMQQYRITLRYLRTWFVLDAVVVIPDWFTRLAQDSSSGYLASLGRILRSARAIRVIRLLRLLKLQKMMNKLYDFIDSEYLFIVMDILRLLLFIVVLNHVIACLWYLLGYIGYEAGDNNWLENTGYTKVIEGSIIWQYTTALHWSLTQFTPAGMDVFARNVPERIMSVIVLGFAVIIFSSVLASVSASMTALRNLQGDSKKQFWLLRRYLRRKQVTTQSRVRIIKFLEHVVMLQAKTVKSSDVSLLGKLSEPLKELLEYEVHKETVMLHPFFHYLGECVHSLMVSCSVISTQTKKQRNFSPRNL